MGTVAAGSLKQEAGPCGSLTFTKFTKPSSCVSFMKAQGGLCADACTPANVGKCTQALVVQKGALTKGTCKSVGFTVAAGSLKQEAGPCGSLTFTKFTKPSSCVSYMKADGNLCADACIPANLGKCTQDLVAKNGGLTKGTCKSVGYTVKVGPLNQKAGPCGNLMFQEYKKVSVTTTSSCVSFMKAQGGLCADACIPANVGKCTQALVVQKGALTKGTCKSVGFTVAAGSLKQEAGPCG